MDFPEKYDMVQNILREWCVEYGMDPDKTSFGGWAELSTGKDITMGRAEYYPKYVIVKLGIRFEDRRLGWMEKSVLWHEFCHSRAYQDDWKPNGHDRTWRAYKNEKKVYVLGDAFAKLLYPFL